jgi:hypothetical protein
MNMGSALLRIGSSLWHLGVNNNLCYKLEPICLLYLMDELEVGGAMRCSLLIEKVRSDVT